MITVNNLHKSFGSLEVLKGVNQHIKAMLQSVMCEYRTPVQRL